MQFHWKDINTFHFKSLLMFPFLSSRHSDQGRKLRLKKQIRRRPQPPWFLLSLHFLGHCQVLKCPYRPRYPCQIMELLPPCLGSRTPCQPPRAISPCPSGAAAGPGSSSPQPCPAQPPALPTQAHPQGPMSWPWPAPRKGTCPWDWSCPSALLQALSARYLGNQNLTLYISLVLNLTTDLIYVVSS